MKTSFENGDGVAMTNGWGWYYSSDEETWYGSYKDKNEAIAAGRDAYEGGKYHVAECHQSLLYVAIFYDIEDRINDMNDDFQGDHEALTDQITRVQWKELELELNEVATKWCKRHNFRKFMFDQVQNKTVHGGENND